MDDLHINVIQQYAAHWEKLGAFLGLEDYEIDVISKDNANRSSEGCEAMLKLWRRKGHLPTWGRLDDAINLVRKCTTVSVDSDALKGRTHYLDIITMKTVY